TAILWESMSPPFFSEALLFQAGLYFFIGTACQAKPSIRRLSFEKPFMKMKGFFVLYNFYKKLIKDSEQGS
ncbi:hypothetical protein, partial [Flavobacterium suncheonense]|uniref:hypothetical protein n=1 Tax=Flavobacterium suncheonense TaxID=350894 RepID=UPI003FA347DE